jgi:hypothetical protein
MRTDGAVATRPVTFRKRQILRRALLLLSAAATGGDVLGGVCGFPTRAGKAAPPPSRRDFGNGRSSFSPSRMPCFASGGKESGETAASSTAGGDNKAMAFLRKIGKVGKVSGVDFVNSIGVDEGPVGKSQGGGTVPSVRKAKSAYRPCVVSGVIDDMSESFPVTSSGTLWSGFTDRVMGGVSFGSLTREEFDGRQANVLRGHVSLANNGGFVQMATDLALDPTVSATVDASEYDGIELDIQCQGGKLETEALSMEAREEETFNVQ